MAEENKKQEEKKELAEAVQDNKAKDEKGEKAKEEIKGRASKTKIGKKEAVVNARDVPLSKKHCMALCNLIRGGKIEKAIHDLREVMNMKRAVPMKGEIPHRKGNIMSGRYPVKAAGHFVKLLNQLSANATNNDVDLEEAIIECIANQASRPYKRFGTMKFKRSHVTLRLVIKDKKKKIKNGRKKIYQV